MFMNKFQSLKTLLSKWEEYDVAQYYVGCCLGLFEYNGLDGFRDNKSIFWTDNTTGDLLHKILQELVAAEVLELDEEQDKVRWK